MKKLLTLLAILTLTLTGCETDTCTECYDVRTTIYYPTFQVLTETVCVDYDCNYEENN